MRMCVFVCMHVCVFVFVCLCVCNTTELNVRHMTCDRKGTITKLAAGMRAHVAYFLPSGRVCLCKAQPSP